MLPTVLIGLGNIPYTPTMKIDRNRIKNWLSEDDVCGASLGEISNVSTALEGPSLSPKEEEAMKLSHLVANIVAARHSVVWTSVSGHDNRLSDIGIDSAQVMRLASMIYKHFRTKMPVEILGSKEMTIRKLAALLTSSETKPDNRTAPETVEARNKFLRERVANFSQSVLGSVTCRKSSKRHAFLTGATGYLGVQVLVQLLRSTDIASVTVLIRGAGLHQASERARHAISAAGSSHDHDQTLHAWPGDLSKASLGLSEDHWSELAGFGQHPGTNRASIDTIIHCGAVVDWTKSYDDLEAANVTSTAQLLKLASDSPHVRRFVFISGGRYPDPAQDDNHDLEAIYADTARDSGYAQTKFVAEQLVDNVRRVTPNKSIDSVSPAYLIGSRDRGLANQDDYLWRIVWASVRVGAFNADEKDQWLFVAEADSVAKRVVALILRDHTYRPTTRLRVLDGLSMHKFWSTVSSVLRVSLTPVSADMWLQRVRQDMDETSNHLLWPLADTLESSHGHLTKGRCLAADVSANPATTGIDLAIQRNIQHLSSVGFFG